jgi:hypothetical protein
MKVQLPLVQLYSLVTRLCLVTPAVGGSAPKDSLLHKMVRGPWNCVGVCRQSLLQGRFQAEPRDEV